MARTQIPTSHAIDIDLAFRSQHEIFQNETRIFPLIQKIQQQQTFCDIDKNVYKPYIISIGPYHHGSTNVKETEKMKYDCLSYILQLNRNLKLEDYIEAINGIEKQVRSCYADNIQMEKKTFVKMLLLDGCFLLDTLHGLDGIVSLVLSSNTSKERMESTIDEKKDEYVIDVDCNQVDGSHKKDEENLDNPEEIHRSLTNIILRDLLLLENQIPFFVIMKIYELVTGGRSTMSLLVENIVQAMEDVLDCYSKANREYDRPKEFYHLFHLCHMYFNPSPIEAESCQDQYVASPSVFHHFLRLNNQPSKKNKQILLPSYWRRATQYNEARIELKKREYSDNDPHSLLDIRFCNGMLKIPCLTFDHEVYDLFRNLAAFEKTCPRFGNYVTAYVVFWSHFINTHDDVALLVEKGIIRHHLHSDREVSDFFKSLGDGCTNFDFSDNYLEPVCNRMEEHYQIWRPRWRKWLASITSKIPSLSRKSKSELPTTLSLGQATPS